MTTPEASAKPAGSARVFARDVLGAAWPLFQVSLPTCLPLAVIAVAAGGSPVADAVALGRTWWGVVIVRTVMVLICYGAMLRQQLQFAGGGRPRLTQSLRDACRDVPAVLVLMAAWILPFLPAVASTALHGFDALALLLTAAASAWLVFVLPAWPAMIAGNTSPWAAVAHSFRRVSGQWKPVAGVVFSLLAGVAVFVLLTGIILGMVMNLAGQGSNPGPIALVVARGLIAIGVALPAVYAGALSVTTWRAIAETS